MNAGMSLCFDETFWTGDAGAGVRCVAADVAGFIASDEAMEAGLSLCSEWRRERIVGMANRRSRAQSLGVTLLLDCLLRSHGLRERDMVYAVGAHGKPSLAAFPQLKFSLAHSGTMAAACLGAVEGQVGVDIERVGRYRPELVRRIFSQHDRERMAAARTEDERQHIFADVWTRTEAYAKATGEGLRWPPLEPHLHAAVATADVGVGYRLCALWMP